jgi:transposase-like zinc ribbon protein
MLPTDLPDDLPGFLERFGSDQQCRAYLFAARWPDGFRCTACGHGRAWAHKARLIDECAACGKQHWSDRSEQALRQLRQSSDSDSRRRLPGLRCVSSRRRRPARSDCRP